MSSLWYDYKALGPKEKAPKWNLKPKPPKRKAGRPPKPEKPCLIAQRENRPYFKRADFIDRLRAITGESRHNCRFMFDAVMAVLISEIELGHEVELPHIGRFTYREKPKNRYYYYPTGEYYISPVHKILEFSEYNAMTYAIKRNTRKIDWTDHCDPRLPKIFTYTDCLC